MFKNKLTAAAIAVAVIAVPFAAANAAESHMSDSKPVKAVKDSYITTKVKSKLASERDGFTKGVSVKTTDAGAVTLSGNVSTKEQSDRAEAIARGTEGVTSVTNSLVVGPAK